MALFSSLSVCFSCAFVFVFVFVFVCFCLHVVERGGFRGRGRGRGGRGFGRGGEPSFRGGREDRAADEFGDSGKFRDLTFFFFCFEFMSWVSLSVRVWLCLCRWKRRIQRPRQRRSRFWPRTTRFTSGKRRPRW